jgi:hypothetical protein
MNQKKIILLILVVAIGLISCDVAWQKYSNREYRFSLLLPRAWEKKAGQKNTLIIAKAPKEDAAHGFQANLNVTVTDLPKEIPLETYFEMNKQETFRILPGVEYNVSEGTLFNGRLRGKWLSFNSEGGVSVLRIISAVWVKGTRIYIITGSCLSEEYEKYDPIFKKILRSLRIK